MVFNLQLEKIGMIDSDKSAQEHMVKEFASNSKKFYDHILNCDSCRSKLADIWLHTYQS